MNKAVPIVGITLDKERNFKLDFRAFMAFEKVSGKNVLAANVWQDMTASGLVTLLWAGLLHEDPNLTLEEVAAFIHPGNIQTVVDVLQEGFGAAMPESGEAGNESPLVINRPIG